MTISVVLHISLHLIYATSVVNNFNYKLYIFKINIDFSFFVTYYLMCTQTHIHICHSCDSWSNKIYIEWGQHTIEH